MGRKHLVRTRQIRKLHKQTRKLRRRAQKQRGGAQEYSNIFDLQEASATELGPLLQELRSQLEERKEQGKQNWLVFFAKYGNPGEKERFSNTNWIFSDTDSDSHVKNQNDRLLIKVNFDNKEILKKLFEVCAGLFDYITFDGAIAGENIDQHTVGMFVQGLSKNGILATSFSKSSVYEDGPIVEDDFEENELEEGEVRNRIDYRAGIFNLPIREVPIGTGTNPPGEDISRLRALLGLMFKAKRMGVQFPESPKKIATAIEFNTIPEECASELSNWYYNNPKMKYTISGKCAVSNNKLKEQAPIIRNLITDAKSSILHEMQKAWSLPVFVEGKKITDTSDYIQEDLVVLIQKK